MKTSYFGVNAVQGKHLRPGTMLWRYMWQEALSLKMAPTPQPMTVEVEVEFESALPPQSQSAPQPKEETAR